MRYDLDSEIRCRRRAHTHPPTELNTINTIILTHIISTYYILLDILHILQYL